MPNTDPVNDNPAVTRFIIEQAQAAKLANVFPIGAATTEGPNRIEGQRDE